MADYIVSRSIGALAATIALTLACGACDRRWLGPRSDGLRRTPAPDPQRCLSSADGPEGGTALRDQDQDPPSFVPLNEVKGDDHKLTFAGDDWVVHFLVLPREQHTSRSLIAKVADERSSAFDRWTAARVLGVRQCKEAMQELRACLTDEDRELAHAAIRALGDIGDRDATPWLVGALEDERSYSLPLFEQDGRTGFGSLQPTPIGMGRVMVANSASAARALGKLRDGRAVAALVTKLKDRRTPFRGALASALGDIGSTSALSALNAARSDADEALSYWARRAVLQIENNHRCQARLLGDLRCKDASVRYHAVRALAERGDAEAIQKLKELLSDETWVARDACLPTVIETIGQAAKEAIEKIELRSDEE